jgi:ribose transport system permease protein
MTTVRTVPAAGETLLAEERRAGAARSKRLSRLSARIERFGVLLPFVLVLALGIALVPNFLSPSAISNIAVQASLTALVGFGMTLVIALRQLDLSVGAGVGLAACVTALTAASLGPALGIAAGLSVGAVVGLVNGFLVAVLKVPSFVATLGTMGIVRGVALLLTGGGSLRIESPVIEGLATGRVLGIPLPVIIAVAALGVAYLLLDRSVYGRHLLAVGGRPEAATETGIGVRRIRLLTFVVAGVFVGTAGVLYAGQLGQVSGTLGTGLELQIIAITVLGGTSLAGGSGNLPGTLIAAVLLAMINAGLNLLNVPSFYQYAAVGILLLFALSLDSLRRTIQRRALQGA